MLSFQYAGTQGPLLVLLHWLGGGAQTWGEVSQGLVARGVRVAAIDLPGFGDAADLPASDVTHAVNAVAEVIRALRMEYPGEPWLLGGHSMGGKIAAIIARHALDGEVGLEGLRGLLFVSPSPPSPEPILEARREEQLKTFGESEPEPKAQRRAAEKWVDGNTGKLPLPPAVRERAVQGVLNNNPRAFRAWFLTGSKEDWSDRVGKLNLPALLFAGTDETSLGEDKQRTYTLPHLPQAQFILLEGVKHLAPLERPGELLEHVTQFLASLGLTLALPEAQPGQPTLSLMHSDHTSPATLAVMSDRLESAQNWNHQPTVFTPEAFRTLRAMASCIVPHAGLDLAACIDRQLAAGKGDGWR